MTSRIIGKEGENKMSKRYKTHKRGKVDPQVLETVKEYFDKEQQEQGLGKQFLEEKRKNPNLIFKEWFKDRVSELKKKPTKKEGLPDFVQDFLKGRRKESLNKDVRDMSEEEYEKFMEDYTG